MTERIPIPITLERAVKKANLGLLNHHYGDAERRILEIFCERPEADRIQLHGWHDIHILYLIKDGLLIKTGRNSGTILNGVPSWEEFQLTNKGRQFIEDWKTARVLE